MQFIKHFCITVIILISLIITLSCERNDYELFDPETAGKWTLYSTADGLPSNYVGDIKLDSRQNLWITFPGYGAARYYNETWTFFRTSTSALLNDGVICLEESSTGTIIFGTSDGISFLSDSNTWSSYTDPASEMYVNTIKVASNGWIWVGTRDQGFYVNSGSGFIKTLIATYQTVNVIEEGENGNIFLGTDNGIIKWDGSSYSYLGMDDGLPDNRVTSMHFDRGKRLWIGTDAGKNVSWIDNSGIHQVNLMTGTDSVKIRDIKEDRRGYVWFATRDNGLIWYDGVVPHSIKDFNGIPETRINCIGEDKDGNLWFGLNSKGLVKYTLPIDGK
jgi:ligand-binding sensor domain-containing protein